MLSLVLRKVHQERCGSLALHLGLGVDYNQAHSLVKSPLPTTQEEIGFEHHNADSQCNDVGDDG
jgi:hypothetical protein